MKILLINPPHPYLVKPNTQAPLGILYLLSMVKKYRPNVDIDVFNASHLSVDETSKVLEECDVYGYTATSIDYYNVLNLIKKMKKRLPNSYHILGGPHATLDRSNIDMNIVDTNFVAEAEYTILEFVDDFLNNKPKKEYVGERIKDIDVLPFPDREALAKKQKELGGNVLMHQKGPSTVILGSRGCAYNCMFCASKGIWSRKVRCRNIDSLVDEIKYVMDKFHITNFRFSDDNMVANTKRFKEFCNKIEPLNINWRISSRVDCINEDILKHLNRGGCKEISFGIESFDPNVLKMMNKRIVPQESIDAVKICADGGIRPRVLMMISTPGETYQYTVDQNIEHIEKIKDYFEMISLTTFVPLPGTDSWINPEKYNIEIISKDLDKFNLCMYVKDKDGKSIETDVWSNILIKGMTREQQFENIRKMREYVSQLPQHNKGTY